MLQCPYCHFENTDGISYCQNCGHKLKNVIYTPSYAEEGNNQDVQQQPLTGAEQSTSTLEQESFVSKRKAISPWLILVPLALIIVFFLGRNFYRNIFGSNRYDYDSYYNTDYNAPSVDSSAYAPVDSVASSNYPVTDSAAAKSDYTETNTATSNINPDEINSAARTLQQYFDCENTGDIDCMAACFTFPVRRFHENYAVSKSNLKDLLQQQMDEMNYHYAQADFQNATIQPYDGKYYFKIPVLYKLGASATDAQKFESLFIALVDKDYKIEDIYMQDNSKK